MSPEGDRASAAPRGRLMPALTLYEVLGPGVAFVPRRSVSVPGWGPTGPGYSDAQTGGLLAVGGPVPFVCSAGASTRETLELLEHAGLPVEAEILQYATLQEYLALLRRLGTSGVRLAVQRAHPDAEVSPAWAWVKTDVLRDLNDKGRLDDVVPRAWQAPRRVVDVAALPPAARLLDGRTAVVLKAASRLPSGGGHCVWICRTEADVERARSALASEARVVVEEHLDLARTVCVHAAVTWDGRCVPLGVAEEVVDAEGHWRGNWFDDDAEAVPDAVRETVSGVVEKAASLGYRGLVGIDVAFPRRGAPCVLDLNFRANGSTAAAWLRGSLLAERGARAARLRNWRTPRPFSDLLRLVRAGVDRGSLLPLALYDPEASATRGEAWATGLVLGASRAEVREEEARLASQGLP